MTLDLGSLPPEEAKKLESQWRGTFDPGSKQGQTIRQRETVSGFRSSLPVKSRFVREKRKNGGGAVPKSLAEVPDYELLEVIGEGGMGVVYAAHQSSIARTVAVKMLKPSAKIREEQRDKFISEAVVTGELDHPNIVPIYDLGANDQGALFYSMKRVKGTPWDKVLSPEAARRKPEHPAARGRRRRVRPCPRRGPSRSEARKRDARRLRRSARDGLGPRADHDHVCQCRRDLPGRQPGRHAGLHGAGNGPRPGREHQLPRATSICSARCSTRSSAASRPTRVATSCSA